jgi:hypothetical protein
VDSAVKNRLNAIRNHAEICSTRNFETLQCVEYLIGGKSGKIRADSELLAKARDT